MIISTYFKTVKYALCLLEQKISEMSLDELFADTLTDTKCVFVDKGREIWIATEMCAHYLESAVDSIVVMDNNSPVGIVGGYDLLDSLRKNPSRDFQYDGMVEDVMFKGVPQIEKEAKFGDLMGKWRQTRRAFAIVPNNKSYSPISARKMLEIGTKCKTDMSASSMPKKRIITFKPDDTLGKIIFLMFENKTRKLLLEDSDQFISDRLILGEISRMLKFEKDVDSFAEIPASKMRLDYAKTVTDDLPFDYLCSIMEKMEHPYVLYKDTAISPWDVCNALMLEDMCGPLTLGYQKKCPHCGRNVH